jgi:hypothetical protein
MVLANILLGKRLLGIGQTESRRRVMVITACIPSQFDTRRLYSGGLSLNHFNLRMFGLTLFIFLFSAIVAQPAMAQQEQATHVHHRLIPAGDTCATCHQVIYDKWKASPHAANGVECTVCHGETTAADFAGKPALSNCEGCHADQVAQLKSDPFMSGKTCVSCHQAHLFAEHKKPSPAGQ